MAKIAREFEGYVDEMLQVRRAAGAQASNDITTDLLRQRVRNRPLRDEEIVSILRNWTVGEVGTISAAIGILAHHLSEHGDLQRRLRAGSSLLPAAIEEILRIHGPLLANRRIATQAVEIGDRTIAAGERISLLWTSANRDARVFEDPGAFRLDRDRPRICFTAREFTSARALPWPAWKCAWTWRNCSRARPKSTRSRTGRRPARRTPPVVSPHCRCGSDRPTPDAEFHFHREAGPACGRGSEFQQLRLCIRLAGLHVCLLACVLYRHGAAQPARCLLGGIRSGPPWVPWLLDGWRSRGDLNPRSRFCPIYSVSKKATSATRSQRCHVGGRAGRLSLLLRYESNSRM